MNKHTLIWKVLATCAFITLNGCGGGSSSTSSTTSTNASGSLSGTVAVGAPMLNATLTVMGANGQTVSTPVDDSGSYSNLNISQLTAPYRIQACGLADGQYQCFYSVVQAGGVANVTPLTDATIALALGADSSTMFTGAAPSAAALSSSQSTLQHYLGALMAAAGLGSSSDFGTTSFTANHSGMDKVLDAVKITSGHNNGATFVQLEGVVGYGNAYIDSQGNQTGSLNGSSLVSGMSVNLSGISTIFQGLNSAIGSGSVGACTSALSTQVPLDPAFAMNMNGQSVTASNVAATLCSFASSGGLLGGKVENPALRSCDFSGPDKICTVGFDLTNGTLTMEGAELAIVLRQGSSTWTLLGAENPYGITVGAAVQRTLRVGVTNAQPSYTRAISIDIPTSVLAGATAPHAAKVYAHDTSGTGAWDLSTPIATLSDSGCPGQPNLTIAGSQCGAEWLSLDSFNSSNLSNGDALIDALYRRGRDLRIDLYSDTAGTAFIATVYVRINGVPPKSIDLPNVAWLNLDAASQSALAAYDSSIASTLALSWASNPVVVPHDVTFCGDSACNAKVHTNLPGTSLQTSTTMNLSGISVAANGYKQLSLYGRDRDDVGFASNYLSCVSGTQNCP
ncbi:hypothetical protein [Trinickia fusca]|uniref:Carboxypeptidase regulatory-like domain-containing protein n=1 Tax=Trinickia fusca TaxID=2419777 RepID=A0A494X5C1_9BURK|nr:hypothetical protein [Trinickia fusca]RKP45560.1 hypothetical protein D7S89_19650 [Trinickia fusca]